MSIEVVFATAGVIALLVGIIGGGIKAKEIEFPILPVTVRLTTILIGIGLIGATLWLEKDNQAQVAQVANPSQTTLPISPEEFAPKLLSEAQNWKLITNTDFDSDAWPKKTLEEEDWTGSEKITNNGTYLVTLNNVGNSPDDGFWIIPALERVSDFYLNVEGKFVAGKSGNSYGIIFRSAGIEPPTYVFRIFEQTYDIQYLDNEWKELSGLTPSPHLRQGRFNRLTVITQGSEFYFYINGNFVHHIIDNQISGGNVGLRISVHQGIEQIIEFDNFELRIPK